MAVLTSRPQKVWYVMAFLKTRPQKVWYVIGFLKTRPQQVWYVMAFLTSGPTKVWYIMAILTSGPKNMWFSLSFLRSGHRQISFSFVFFTILIESGVSEGPGWGRENEWLEVLEAKMALESLLEALFTRVWSALPVWEIIMSRRVRVGKPKWLPGRPEAKNDAKCSLGKPKAP